MPPKKQRGGPADWTTKEQKLWLVAQLPGLTAARTSGKFTQFWADTFEGWFSQWPNDLPTAEELTEGIDAAEQMKSMKGVSKLYVFHKSRSLPKFLTNRD
jgi:hypothetical protein